MQPKRLTNMSGVLCSNTGTGQMRTEEDAVKAREPTCISSPACRSSVNEYQAVIALMGALGVTYTRANKTPTCTVTPRAALLSSCTGAALQKCQGG